MWWDLGHFVLQNQEADASLRSLGHHQVEAFCSDLTDLVRHVQGMFATSNVILHTAILRNQSDWAPLLTNSAAAQLNAGIRHVAVQIKLPLIDFQLQLSGLEPQQVLKDALHPKAWVSLHMWNKYLQCF